MKVVIHFISGILLFSSAIFQAQAFSSLYVFGDALSSTTDNPETGSLYYGKRYSNGRVWIEVLAQRQGLIYDSSKNNSYYDHNSGLVVKDIKNFTITQANAANSLFIVWVCNADTFDAASASDNQSQWATAIKQSQANHLQIITNLYAMGVRTLIMPNAVDISKIPAYNHATSTGTMSSGCVNYNVAFSNTISQARILCPGLTIYAPDFFSLLNSALTNAGSYGLTNALKNGLSIDALDDPQIQNVVSTNGSGTNYIFWDKTDPTAKFHEVIADVTQQIISPVQISQITVLAASNRLDVVNMPVGLNGFVDNGTNLSPNLGPVTWTAVQNFSSSNVTQSIFVPTPPAPKSSQQIVPADGGFTFPGGPVVVTDLQFYKLYFPYAWTWP